MTDSVKDLSLLAGEPIQVTLVKDGPVYLLPADIPIPTMLRIEAFREKASQDEDLDQDAVLGFYQDVLSVFQVHEPDMKELPVGPSQLFGILTAVYGDQGEAEPAGPTRAKAATSGATRPRTRAGRKSRSSA